MGLPRDRAAVGETHVHQHGPAQVAPRSKAELPVVWAIGRRGLAHALDDRRDIRAPPLRKSRAGQGCH